MMKISTIIKGISLVAGFVAIASTQTTFAQGDDCATATAITAPGTYGGSTVGMGADVAPTCITTDGTGGGVWYSITGNNDCASFTADLCTGTTYDSKIRVYEGTCGALVCVTGNDDFCGVQSQVTWDYTPGVTYYILVHGFSTNEGTYSMVISEGVASVDVTAPVLSPNGIVDVSATTNITCMANFSQADLAQSFIPSQNTICGAGIETTAASTGADSFTIELWDALPNGGGTMLATGTDVGTGSTWIDVTWPSVSITPGLTYYIVVTSTNTGLCWAGDLNNGYPDGMTHANAGYGAFPNYDYAFRTSYGCGGLMADLTDACSVSAPVAPIAIDACVGAVTGTPDVTFPITTQGTTVVTWSFDDGSGNISTTTQNVIIADVTAPVLNAGGGIPDVNVTTNNTCMAGFGQVDLAQSFIPSQNTICGAGIFLDGNAAGAGDVTIELWDALPNGGGTMLATGMVNMTDGTWGDVNWVPVSITPGLTYYLVVTGTNGGQCWAGDLNNGYPDGMTHANAGYSTFPNYDYVFRTLYGCSGVSDFTAECSASVIAPTATDDCAGTVTGTPDVTFPITTQGTTVVTWSFDDGNGNISTETQNVILTDAAAPVADSVSLLDEVGCISVTPVAPTATDNCLGTVTGTPDVTFPVTTAGTTLVTWTFDDGNGNTSTQTQNVIVNTVDNGVTQTGTTLTADAAGATYQWIDCSNNNAIAGETNAAFTPTDLVGDYAVVVTENGCTDTSACITIDYTGLTELNSFDVSIYPNPSNGIFNVEFNGLNEGELEMRIMDLQGRIVLTERFNALEGNHIQEVNISESETGVYIIEVSGENGVIFSKRIIKE